MRSVTSLGNSKGSSRPWWAAAVVLLLIGAGFLAVGIAASGEPLAGPAAAPQVSPQVSLPADGNTTPSTTPPAVVARSAPVALRIPAIDVSVSLSTLGLNPDNTVQVPTKFQEPGWYRLGPAPGQVGSAVILGHVDDKAGPAVFYRLKSLRAGDKVEVSLASGLVVHFVVTKVATYLKAQFPARLVYASRGYSALQLVTCGGQFDTHAGSYLSNVVVYTTLVSTTPSTG